MTRDAAEIGREVGERVTVRTLKQQMEWSPADLTKWIAEEVAAAIEQDRAEREAWLPIETAPIGTRVLVWGNGPVRFGYLDRLGQWWRRLHHTPMPTLPTRWRHVPSPSEAPDQAREVAR